MKKLKRIAVCAAWLLMSALPCAAEGTPTQITLPQPGSKTLLNKGWLARKASEVLTDGNMISSRKWNAQGWIPATVPGTVLTTLLNNGMYPAPEVGLNNNLIPDIYNVGREFYTYWFAMPFECKEMPAGRQVWLNFRGINYMADIYLNGKRINTVTHEGMFLRRSFNITEYLRTDTLNILAVHVEPPLYPGNPNGGQGGDGIIARNNTMQYTAGWDWIQPVRDRNTGIWDEVSITTTGAVKVAEPYVVTKVPGVRKPSDAKQKDAIVKTNVEVENTTATIQKGNLILETNGTKLTVPVTLAPLSKKTINFADIAVKNPKLWWPNGIGAHPLYDMSIRFEANGSVSDEQTLRYGIREIVTEKDANNGGRKFFVNGQPIYITGGNYINSDWLLRLTPERYKDEVRFHAEMNVRMIRVWGGALLERPEFYNACDEEGILVFQDLWGSGDCNGAWEDAMKADSRERRWEYPDNHDLFLKSVEDQVKMVRNHPSLCFWCGANEWPLAKDIDEALTNKLMPELDPERLFAHCSTDSTFTRNLLGDNGDGPYGIQELDWFFTFRSHPFNPESGSVGTSEIESLREIFPESDLKQFPRLTDRFGRGNVDWRYHKDSGYGDHLARYGKYEDIETYSIHAQVVSYDQYRSFMEGWASHMWDWYTGILIWKTQNPWTALRGQMYDWYLDVNACLYGTRKGCEPVHPYYNMATAEVEIMNSSVEDANGLTVKAEAFGLNGECKWAESQETGIAANSVSKLFKVPAIDAEGVYFLKLTLMQNGKELNNNIYWLTNKSKDYSSLNTLAKTAPKANVTISKKDNRYVGEITLSADKISFFNRIKVFNKQTGKRILAVHYTDNYITLMPGDSQTVTFDFPVTCPESDIQVVIDGWNTDRVIAK